MTIDAHHHFWNYSPAQYEWISEEMKVLKRDFLPPDLLRVTEPAGIEGVVSVQARQSLVETEFLLANAEANAFVRGIVGWVPLIDPKVADTLAKYAHCGKFKGVRHVLQSEDDDFYLLRDDFNRGVSQLHDFGLVYDILIFQKHLPQTIRFVDKHPEQVFVLDHIAKPVIASSKPPREWSEPITELARRVNVFCKLSGMVTEVRGNTWDANLLKPYYDVVLEAFGPERLMFGSDWPVCLLRSDYHRWVETVRVWISALSSDEQSHILGATAARVYGL